MELHELGHTSLTQETEGAREGHKGERHKGNLNRQESLEKTNQTKTQPRKTNNNDNLQLQRLRGKTNMTVLPAEVIKNNLK